MQNNVLGWWIASAVSHRMERFILESKRLSGSGAVSLWKRPFVARPLPGSWSGSSLYGSFISSPDPSVHRRSPPATGKTTLRWTCVSAPRAQSPWLSFLLRFCSRTTSRFLKAQSGQTGRWAACVWQPDLCLAQEDYCPFLPFRSWHLSPVVGQPFVHLWNEMSTTCFLQTVCLY